MARPVKSRRITGMPTSTRFIPSELWEEDMPENILKMEELEALRLKDLEGFEQEVCAIRMAVSRPTFQRILLSAREKVADSLLHGKAIRIEGGDYTRVKGERFCRRCGRSWENHAVGTAGARASLRVETSAGTAGDSDAESPESKAGHSSIDMASDALAADIGESGMLCPECNQEPDCGHGGRRRGRRRRSVLPE